MACCGLFGLALPVGQGSKLRLIAALHSVESICITDARGRAALWRVGSPGVSSSQTHCGGRSSLSRVYICQLHGSETKHGVQTRVVGLRYGEWGRQEFGKKPVKVDTLEWQIKRLDELKRQILEQASPKQRQISATAFVTFKCAPAMLAISGLCWQGAAACSKDCTVGRHWQHK